MSASALEEVFDLILTNDWADVEKKVRNAKTADVVAARNEYKSNLLRSAVKENCPVSLAKLLLDKGVALNEPCRDGRTPLFAAAEMNVNPDLVLFLLENGADPNRPSPDGWNPLHAAFEKGASVELISNLLAYGGNTDIPMPNGKKIIDVVRAKGRNDYVQIISYPPAQKTPSKGSGGTGKVSSLLASLGLSSGKAAGSGPKEHIIFFSYAHKDTAGETAKLAEKAAARFPGKSIFRDADIAFRLDDLVSQLEKAKNIIILLSGNYARSAYSLIELHNALKCKANVITVKVERSGMDSFDFAKIAEDMKAENFSNYLDDAGWKLLAAHGISQNQAAENLKRLTNIRALDFSFNFALAVQDAMIEEIFKAVKE